MYQTMTNPGTKHILLFLKFILKKIDTLNFEFQSKEFRLHQVHRSISDEYRTILSLYIKETVLASMQLSEINPGKFCNILAIFCNILEKKAILMPLDHISQVFRAI